MESREILGGKIFTVFDIKKFSGRQITLISSINHQPELFVPSTLLKLRDSLEIDEQLKSLSESTFGGGYLVHGENKKEKFIYSSLIRQYTDLPIERREESVSMEKNPFLDQEKNTWGISIILGIYEKNPYASVSYNNFSSNNLRKELPGKMIESLTTDCLKIPIHLQDIETSKKMIHHRLVSEYMTYARLDILP